MLNSFILIIHYLSYLSNLDKYFKTMRFAFSLSSKISLRFIRDNFILKVLILLKF